MANFMREHSRANINGLPMAEVVSTEGHSVASFVDKVVLPPNEQASLVVLVIVPACLGISVDVALFDGTGKAAPLFLCVVEQVCHCELRRCQQLRPHTRPQSTAVFAEDWTVVQAGPLRHHIH